MIQTLVIGIAGIVCAVIGASAMWYVQTILRKEKFKESVYREQLAAYKEIAELGFKVWYGCLHLALDHEKMKDLAADARRFQECLDKHRLFILGSINAEAIHFTYIVTKVSSDLMGLPKQEIKDLLLEESRTRQVEKSYYRLVNEMRKDLCIEAITKDIHKTFEFGL
jgi:hypothetical protein